MSDQLQVTLVQTELVWEDVMSNLDNLDTKLDAVHHSDLVVLPEMFTTGFTMNPTDVAETMSGQTVAWMQEKAKYGDYVLCGSVIIKEDGNYFNRFIAAYPNGELKTYDKKHLFGLAGENEPYTAGEVRVLLDVKGWKILPLICYDLRFPVWARSKRTDQEAWEYDALLFVANWPKPRINAWDVLLQARAIENQAYCIAVNRIGTDGKGLEYVGHSAAYDYAGEEVIAPNEKDGVSTATISKSSMDVFREKLPFQKDADGFELV